MFKVFGKVEAVRLRSLVSESIIILHTEKLRV